MEHLIPQQWFLGQPQWLLLVIAVVAIATLGKGADWLVDGASGIAYRMGIPKVIVGATIVSLGTTSPEAAVSVLAAWQGQPGLALGNGVGSVIVDSGLIFGLGCLITVLPADRFVLQRQGWVQFGSAVLLSAICYGLWWWQGDYATLGRPVGLFLLALLAGYLWISIRWSREHPAGEPFQDQGEEVVEATEAQRADLLLLAAAGGLVLVLLASRVLIGSVTELAEAHWHVPQVVIAATLVAFGTSLPELVIGITSILKGHTEILVGNIIGADILNVLFVIGAAAVAAPLPLVEIGSAVPHILFYVHLPTMLLILLLFRVFIARASHTGSFRRWYGVPLIGIYVGYAVLQFVLVRG